MENGSGVETISGLPRRNTPDRRAHNIEDGVDRPHLMKMHLVFRHAVDFGFRPGDALKNFQGTFAHLGFETAFFDEGADVPQVRW